MGNAHKRRKSLFQKESQVNNSQLPYFEFSRDLNDSMIIKRPKI